LSAALGGGAYGIAGGCIPGDTSWVDSAVAEIAPPPCSGAWPGWTTWVGSGVSPKPPAAGGT
jgi:hypothetical protein